MFKLFTSVFFFSAALWMGLSNNQSTYRTIENNCFEPGEVIEYTAHYGFVHAAKGKMVISKDIYTLNNRPCYKIDVFGESIGMFDMFLRIRDNWGTYLDTASIVSHKFYRVIEEGKYRKNEVVTFNHEKQQAKVKTYDHKKEKWKSAEYFDTKKNIQDLVSGYYYLRVLDFNKYKEGDIITIDAFFDDELYKFQVRYIGKETIKTKLGKIKSLVLSPIMPENSLFDGENSIKVWISDDLNKVPLKIKAEMFVGAVEIDINNYEKS